MMNITDLMFRYLDAKQHIWNSYFYGHVTNLIDCEPLESFEEIDRRLFFVLVCYPLGMTLAHNNRSWSQILVSPLGGMTSIPIMASQPSTDGNAYWASEAPFVTKGLRLSFIDFFQWDRYRFLSSSIVRCRIETTLDDQSFVGREVIVNLRDVEFLFYGAGAPLGDDCPNGT